MTNSSDYVIEMRKIDKAFPGVRALDQVDFALRAGELRALVGKNGAGKSTLVNVLTGVYPADGGEIVVRGAGYAAMTTTLSTALGIQCVHQHSQLVPSLSIAENIFCGDLPTSKLGLVDWRRVHEQAQARLLQLGLQIDVRRKVEGLSVAERQIIEIAKALFADAQVIVLDEATAPLPKHEVQMLFSFVRAQQARGVAFIYISHYLEEIFELCDTVTVMRDGRNIGDYAVKALTQAELIRLISGVQLEQFQRLRARQARAAAGQAGMAGPASPAGASGMAGPPGAASPTGSAGAAAQPGIAGTASPAGMAGQAGTASQRAGHPALEIRGLTRAGVYRDVDLTLVRGEIVGLTGLEGSGKDALARGLFGLEALGTGEVRVEGQRYRAADPRQALSLGVAYLPRDRHGYGIVGMRPVRENITLPILRRLRGGLGLLSGSKEQRLVQQLIDKLNVKTPSQEQPVEFLSGGNQQKVVFAKLTSVNPKVLLLDEPTQGVDVQAKVEILKIVDQLAQEGAAVVVIAEEIRELLDICDRILVMFQGQIVAEFAVGEPGTTVEAIMGAIEGTPVAA